MSTAIAQTWYMTQRQLMVFARQPAYAVITLIQPVIWLFLFGSSSARSSSSAASGPRPTWTTWCRAWS